MRWARTSWLALTLFASCTSHAPSAGAPSAVASGHESSAVEPEVRDGALHVRGVGLKTPESVVHDAQADVYLVSNIDGSPLEADDRAFISRVTPDGRVEDLRWIDADDPDVMLDAPKGLVLVGDILYVADISFVRKFDRRTGRPLGSVKIDGATFANDVCADAAGNIYVSDSGITVGFTPSGGDAIYKIDARDNVSVLARDAILGRPNGLATTSDGLWVATFGTGELYKLNANGERSSTERPPKGSLDGIAQWHERLFVSSWEGSAVYEHQNGKFVERVSAVPAPSDIGFDQKRQRLLIPLFYDDALVIHPL